MTKEKFVGPGFYDGQNYDEYRQTERKARHKKREREARQKLDRKSKRIRS